MVVTWHMFMVFPKGQKPKKIKQNFLEFIRPKCTAISEKYGIVIKPARSYFDFSFNIYKNETVMDLSSNTSASELFSPIENLRAFLENLAVIIAKIEPILAYWTWHSSDDDTISADFEYYSNPYFFCIEPWLGSVLPRMGTKSLIKSLKTGDFSEVNNRTHEFLYDKKTLKQINRFKKILPRDELIDLLKKYSESVIIGKSGVGVIKKHGGWISTSYPRYFIREALRNKGERIEEGITELTYYLYMYKLKKSEEFADKILNFSNKNLKSKHHALLMNIYTFLSALFPVRPQETVATYKKFMEKNPSFFRNFKPKESAGERISGYFIWNKENRAESASKFLDELVRLKIFTPALVEDIKKEYWQAYQSNDFEKEKKLVKQIGRRMDEYYNYNFSLGSVK